MLGDSRTTLKWSIKFCQDKLLFRKSGWLPGSWSIWMQRIPRFCRLAKLIVMNVRALLMESSRRDLALPLLLFLLHQLIERICWLIFYKFWNRLKAQNLSTRLQKTTRPTFAVIPCYEAQEWLYVRAVFYAKMRSKKITHSGIQVEKDFITWTHDFNDIDYSYCDYQPTYRQIVVTRSYGRS